LWCVHDTHPRAWHRTGMAPQNSAANRPSPDPRVCPANDGRLPLPRLHRLLRCRTAMHEPLTALPPSPSPLQRQASGEGHGSPPWRCWQYGRGENRVPARAMSGRRGFPVSRQQLVQIRGRRRRNPPEHVFHPLRRIQAVPTRRDRQAVDHRAPPRDLGMPGEQPVRLPNRRQPNRPAMARSTSSRPSSRQRTIASPRVQRDG
jgi:hypothetical protein